MSFRFGKDGRISRLRIQWLVFGLPVIILCISFLGGALIEAHNSMLPPEEQMINVPLMLVKPLCYFIGAIAGYVLIFLIIDTIRHRKGDG
jgi:hypothetical protein